MRGQRYRKLAKHKKFSRFFLNKKESDLILFAQIRHKTVRFRYLFFQKIGARACAYTLLHGSFNTPKNASPNMPLDIFEVPASRSMKIIDSSTVRKPCFHAVYFISIWKP